MPPVPAAADCISQRLLPALTGKSNQHGGSISACYAQKKSDTKLAAPLACSIGIMRETIEFMRKSAEELRDLASSAPDISDQLRRLADELDATASELERRPGRAP